MHRFSFHVCHLFKMTKDQPVAQKCTCMFAENKVLYRYMKSILCDYEEVYLCHNFTALSACLSEFCRLRVVNFLCVYSMKC